MTWSVGLVVAFVLLLSVAQPPAVELTNSAPIVHRGVPAVETTIINRTDSTLTAWKVAIIYTLSNGRTSERAITKDVFDVVAGLNNRDTAPGPRSSTREVFSIPTPAGVTLQSATTSLELAVFVDGTWIGSERAAKELFDQRAKTQRVWTFVDQALAAGERLGGLNGLDAALNALNTEDPEFAHHPTVEVMRSNIRRAFSGQLPARPTATQFLRSWREKTAARISATQKFTAMGNERRTR